MHQALNVLLPCCANARITSVLRLTMSRPHKLLTLTRQVLPLSQFASINPG